MDGWIFLTKVQCYFTSFKKSPQFFFKCFWISVSGEKTAPSKIWKCPILSELKLVSERAEHHVNREKNEPVIRVLRRGFESWCRHYFWKTNVTGEIPDERCEEESVGCDPVCSPQIIEGRIVYFLTEAWFMSSVQTEQHRLLLSSSSSSSSSSPPRTALPSQCVLMKKPTISWHWDISLRCSTRLPSCCVMVKMSPLLLLLVVCVFYITCNSGFGLKYVMESLLKCFKI